MDHPKASAERRTQGAGHLDACSIQLTRASAAAGVVIRGDEPQRQIVAVSILSLRPGESPRLAGEEKAHIARLAEVDCPLPPILVDRRSMRVIDGMHRLLAASLKGQDTIDVEFFDGSPEDAFLRAVEANVTHGLPLSQADRRIAAGRIVISHPYMSDRAIAVSTGLAARTVATIRRSSTSRASQLGPRVGRDGRVRPLDGAAGRQRVADFMTQWPGASLRDIARAAGVSPATASDVRRRLARGEDAVPARPDADREAAGEADVTVQDGAGAQQRQDVVLTPATALAKLRRDPSLRQNEQGRWLLRLLHFNAVAARGWPQLIAALPPHCTALIVQLARDNARMWLGVAQQLDERARVIDPLAARRAKSRTQLGAAARDGKGAARSRQHQSKACFMALRGGSDGSAAGTTSHSQAVEASVLDEAGSDAVRDMSVHSWNSRPHMGTAGRSRPQKQ